LADFTVHVNIIEYYIIIAIIVVKFNLNVAGCPTAIGIVFIACAQGPVGYNGAANEEVNMLTANCTAGSYNNISSRGCRIIARIVVVGVVAVIGFASSCFADSV
jgi:hypothetical protein